MARKHARKQSRKNARTGPPARAITLSGVVPLTERTAERHSAARSSLRPAALTLVSRVLGLVRDRFQAVLFGTGLVATAWEIAYMLPNMLRNLLADGVMAQAFVPVYSEAIRESEEEGRRVAGIIISFLFLFLLLIIAGGWAVFPWVLPPLSGLPTREAVFLVELARVLFVFILAASLTAVLAGISNTHHFFSVPALSPIILNLCAIAGFLFLFLTDPETHAGAYTLAYFVTAGGFIQLAVQAAYVYRKGLFPNLQFRFRHPALRKIFFLMAPAVLGASLFPLNQMADVAIAGYFLTPESGAVPALRFAHRLIQLPTGLIGAALATTILPALAAGLRRGAPTAENSAELAQALSFGIFLTVPASLGLIVFSRDILNLLFYGGAWTLESTEAAHAALQLYAVGVPFYSVNRILTSAYYAYQDTRTPVRVMVTAVFLNLGLNLLFVIPLGQAGLAFSTSLAAIYTCFRLLGPARERLDLMPGPALFRAIRAQLPVWFLCVFVALFFRLAFDLLPVQALPAGLRGVQERAALIVLPGVFAVAFVYLSYARRLRLSEFRVLAAALPGGRRADAPE